jgi:hypothetical protein
LHQLDADELRRLDLVPAQASSSIVQSNAAALAKLGTRLPWCTPIPLPTEFYDSHPDRPYLFLRDQREVMRRIRCRLHEIINA